MRVLVVDDEPLARKELRQLLAAFPDVQLVGEAANLLEAERQVDALSPDLLLLDIQLPGATGFELLERLDRVPRVIFTTAYDQYALRAFEVNALDYLLKPVEPARLTASLERARNAMSTPRASNAAFESGPQEPIQQLFVRDGPRCWFIPVAQVRMFEAEGNYVRIHWGTVQPLLSRSLSGLEPRLDPRQFFRINRQQVINLEFVISVELGLGGRLHLRLRDGAEVEVSRRQARELKSKLGA